MKTLRTRSRPAAIAMELTPMIDVVFLLLVFFMCTLRFRTLEGTLATYLPRDRGAEPSAEDLVPEEKIRLKLSLRGDRCLCAVNGRTVGALPAARPRVFERIRSLRKASPGSPAEIAPDPAVPHRFVVSLIDECLRARVQEIHFVAALPALKTRGG